MNLVGYLITLANIQSFDKSGGPLKDLSIKVAEIQTHLNDLYRYPGFNIENYRKTGYYRDGNVGKYLSQNLRDYAYDGIGNPTDEAIVLTLYFKDMDGPVLIKNPNDSLSFFLHKAPKGQVDNDVKRGIDNYVRNLRYKNFNQF